jgi:hypothetical protein
VANNNKEDSEVEIARLRDLDLEGLRARWRSVFGRSAPSQFAKFILFRMLAYRHQAQTLGDLSPATARFLDGLARNGGAAFQEKSNGSVALPGLGQLRPGTVLVREHNGKRFAVTVVEDGFAWNGKTYSSLTKVAKTITGTNWNGPRFFGLRDKTREKDR